MSTLAENAVPLFLLSLIIVPVFGLIGWVTIKDYRERRKDRKREEILERKEKVKLKVNLPLEWHYAHLGQTTYLIGLSFKYITFDGHIQSQRPYYEHSPNTYLIDYFDSQKELEDRKPAGRVNTKHVSHITVEQDFRPAEVEVYDDCVHKILDFLA